MNLIKLVATILIPLLGYFTGIIGVVIGIIFSVTLLIIETASKEDESSSQTVYRFLAKLFSNQEK
jgi:hypothetical protein